MYNELINKAKERKKSLKITIKNLTHLTGLSARTINRFFSNENVTFKTANTIAYVLGLDLSGKEILSIRELEKRRAMQKAIFITGITQGISALELQAISEKDLKEMELEAQKTLLSKEYKPYLWCR